MTTSLEHFLKHHPYLMPEATSAVGKERIFPIRLPEFPDGRQFRMAWVILPTCFPDACARIRLSNDAVLRIPHIERNGNLCFEGDAGPDSGASAEERLNDLIFRFHEAFLYPWLTGELDGDFELESRNYWEIHVAQSATSYDAVTRIYTVDTRHPEPRVYSARLLLPGRIIVAGENTSLADRFVVSLGVRARQVCNVKVADIPIAYELTPLTWPQNQVDLEHLISCRLDDAQRKQFREVRRRRPCHRIVILRAPHCAYGFLLTGGPPTVVETGKIKRAYPTMRMLPLPVDRLDSAWTCGRDQHSEVGTRQQRHVLALGAGALGSPVIDQLARAGIGLISIVDPDIMSVANIGRHLLGAESVGYNKASAVALHIAQSNPSCRLIPYVMSAQAWITKYSLAQVDVVLDMTGEPDVRSAIENARRAYPIPLLIGWMEPYVAAAHACLLPIGESWMCNPIDPLESLQSVDWPDDVIQREPGCSSQFQSYTHAAAAHAVALVTEAALALSDNNVRQSFVRSWVRGQCFLDAHYPGLVHRNWAQVAASFDGVILERGWHG